MSRSRIIIVGGGAAGFFAAIACAEAAPNSEVIILEKTAHFLSKVRISGGGRCNVTHACFDARELTKRFPRGERALIAPFHRFQASDTVAWFEARGVKLKVEPDGRMFPSTDSSQTIIDCLMRAAREAGVRLVANCGVEQVRRAEGGAIKTAGRRDPVPLSPQRGEGLGVRGAHVASLSDISEISRRHHPSPSFPLPVEGGGKPEVPGSCDPTRAESQFEVTCSNGETLSCDRLLLATGGCRTPALGQLATSLGHTLEAPVPSLFTFHIEAPWLRALAGVSIESAEVSVPDTQLREKAALLITHWGLSGPAVLRLSAWGARALHELNYDFTLLVNWLPHLNHEMLARELEARRKTQPAKLVINAPVAPLSARLWEALVLASGVARETRWSALSRTEQHRLIEQLLRGEFHVTGKSLNKDEFVTCGGVRLGEVNFKTMESRLVPGLHFAGELLDIDGITGGFNFQSAWTTGWLAGRAMAGIQT